MRARLVGVGFIWLFLVTVVGGLAVGGGAPAGAAGVSSISGVVTSDATGVPLAGISVCAYSWTGLQPPCATTDASGAYTLDLPASSAPGSPENWILTFTDPGGVYSYEYWNDTNDEPMMDQVPVSDGDHLTGFNAGLATAPLLSGYVLFDDDGSPASDARVCATPTVLRMEQICTTVDPATGHYQFVGLVPGEFAISFQSPGAQFVYQELTDATGALAPIVLVGGGVDVVDARVQRGATISGVVTDAITGAPIGGATVCVQSDTGYTYRCVDTAADGTYTATGLRPGDYTLLTNPNSASYAAEYWDDWHGTAADSTLIAVSTLTEHVTGIDVALSPPGQMAIQVVDESTGMPIEGIEVCAVSALIGEFCSFSSAEGSVWLTVPPGIYTLRFHDPSGTYLDEFWQDAPDSASAMTLTTDDYPEGLSLMAHLGLTVPPTTTTTTAPSVETSTTTSAPATSTSTTSTTSTTTTTTATTTTTKESAGPTTATSGPSTTTTPKTSVLGVTQTATATAVPSESTGGSPLPTAVIALILVSLGMLACTAASRRRNASD